MINIVQAAENSVVSCQGADCSICSLMETINNIYNFILGISFAAAVLVLVVAGFAYVFTAGRRSYLGRAKLFVRNGLIGFLLVITGWLVIHTLFFVSGYQNSGSWWQFQCTADSVGTSNNNNSDSLKVFSTMADFLGSGEKIGVVKGPLSTDRFLNQIKAIGEGEKLIFYLQAERKTADGIVSERIPFLAGIKQGSDVLNLDPRNVDYWKNLLGVNGDISSGDLSFVGENGTALTSGNSSELMDRLFKSVVKLYVKNFGADDSITSLIGQYNSVSSAANLDILGTNSNNISYNSVTSQNISDVDQMIANLTPQLQDLEKTNPGNTDFEKMLSDATTGLIEKAKVVAERTDIASDATSTLISSNSGDRMASATSSKPNQNSSVSLGGDRSQTSAANSNNNSSTNPLQQTPGPMQPISPDNWKKQATEKDAPPGNGSDDFGDLDKDRKQKPDKMDPGDWNNGDGTPEAIKKALRRIHKRDKLRYEMIFRFVQHIGDQPGGGLCTGCGDIYATHTQRIFDIAHIVVHEATHSGHACTIGWEGFSMGEIEAIACANQQGSLYRGKTPDMKEFPRSVESIQYKGKEVRGHLARYWTGVNPAGDLDDSTLDNLFKTMTDYPISKGYQNEGEYPYGWGEGYHLKLPQRLEDVVKTVMTKSGPIDCSTGSCPTSDLPKLGVKCECSPIQID